MSMRSTRRRGRIYAAGVVSVGCIVVFGAVGGVGFAAIQGKPAQYQYGKKATICHKGKKTLRVSVSAVPAHLRHGDTLGPCNGTASAQQKQKKNNGKANGKAKNNAAQGS
jgi:hypothetical protein